MPKSFPHKSFTLIEMLVIVVIIGILASVLIPRLTGAKERANDSARIVKVWQISSAVELYAQENGTTYPLAPLTSTGTSIATPSVSTAISPYMTTIPTDPGKGTVAISTAPWNIMVTGDSFAYWTNTGWTIYAITALMESKKGNTTNATEVIDSDKQWWYQKVGKGLSYAYGLWGKAPIWVTQFWTDLVISDGTNTYTIMDRNLWASIAGTGQASYWYYYQRGNNFGFWNGLAGYTNEDWNAWITTTNTLVSNPQQWYKNSVYVLWDINSQFDWKTPHSNDLRPEGSQWPCPNGYHIPTYHEWDWLVSVRASLSGKSRNDWVLFSNDVNLPRAWLRDLKNWNRWQGEYGGYWSSTPDNRCSTALAIDTWYLNPADYFCHAIGVSLRCFKN